MRELAGECDFFVQSCRPGVLAKRGLGAEDLAALRPGVVYVSVSCYGHAGPWQDRPGWEQLAQAASGLATTQGTPDQPTLLPAVYCDYTTGYLGALGALAALARRHQEGGSYHVRVSLVQTAMWLERQGATLDPAQASGVPERDDWFTETDTAYGRLRQLSPAIEMPATPPVWRRPTVPPGTDPPSWPPRPTPPRPGRTSG
jgi:crotonobetainyl-CoA:carnitine CoA-transferase CaiB-like acyl-CoA transferase